MTGRAGARGGQRAGGIVRLDGHEPRAARREMRDGGGGERADADRHERDVGRVRVAELLEELDEDRRVAVRDPGGDLLVAGPGGVGDEDRAVAGELGRGGLGGVVVAVDDVTRAPSDSIAAIRAAAVPAGTSTSAPISSSAATNATARPWLPSVAQTTRMGT